MQGIVNDAAWQKSGLRSIRSVVSDLTPPILSRWIQGRRSGSAWRGRFPTWEAAERSTSGYSGHAILERVKEATARVLRGDAAFERDSVTFPVPEYNWAMLAILLSVAARRGGALRVVDFGGSLGSTYLQHRNWLSGLSSVHWGVVEQPAFVECGRQMVEDVRIRFYASMRECASAGGADLVLFSSVLQYLPDPWQVLSDAVALEPLAVVVDRTGFVNEGPERITAQVVPAEIYDASYPCRFFEQAEMERRMAPLYRLAATFASLDRHTPFAKFRGLYFERVANR